MKDNRMSIKLYGERFIHFGRNARWGTCVACPQDSSDNKYPEFCPYTDRGDHQLTLDQLVDAWKIMRGEKT